jgi:predicted kinase
MARLILMCGLPGAGKTTRACELAARRPGVRLTPDEWMAGLGIDPFDEPARARLEDTLWTHTQQLLRLGLTVILDFGFWGRGERDEKRAAARALGVPVELHYLPASLDELARRLDARNTSGPIVITRALLQGYAGLIQPPDEAELGLFDRPADAGGGT